MFYVVGHDTLSDSGSLQKKIMTFLQQEQINRANSKIPYTKERQILHYATNSFDDPEYPDYHYFSYINAATKQLLQDYKIDFEELGTIDSLPAGTSLLIRNSRFL